MFEWKKVLIIINLWHMKLKWFWSDRESKIILEIYVHSSLNWIIEKLDKVCLSYDTYLYTKLNDNEVGYWDFLLKLILWYNLY